VRISSRSIEEISWDLYEIKKLAFIPGKATRYKTNLGEELGSAVAGCFELLVAEAFSVNLGLKYFLSCEIEPPLCVVWNGQLNSLSNKLVPKCAPQGKPDVEVYTPDGAWVVDATLAGDTGVQLAEARRLKRHNPTLTSNINKRILVMLSPKIRCEGIEIIEAKALAPAHPKRGKISYVEEVMKLIKEKCLGI
jgi:hypothetical protein